MHEMATNAVKYGALSIQAGRVAVRWSVDTEADRLDLTGQDAGGPPVSPPTGFGSGVVRSVHSAQIGGTVDLSFAESGVVMSSAPTKGLRGVDDPAFAIDEAPFGPSL